MKWKSLVSDSLQPHGVYSPWNSPGQNTGVGSLSFLQGIFPTQGSNLGLPRCRRILCQLSHKGSPRILEWIAYPFSRGSSRPRNQTRVTCIAGKFFTNWAVREAGGNRNEEKRTISSFTLEVRLLRPHTEDEMLRMKEQRRNKDVSRISVLTNDWMVWPFNLNAED